MAGNHIGGARDDEETAPGPHAQFLVHDAVWVAYPNEYIAPGSTNGRGFFDDGSDLPRCWRLAFRSLAADRDDSPQRRAMIELGAAGLLAGTPRSASSVPGVSLCRRLRSRLPRAWR